MKHYLIPICLLMLSACAAEPDAVSNNNQRQVDRYVGGRCEGCEAANEFGSKKLSSADTLPGAGKGAPMLKITGTVLKKDGSSPARDVVIYIHHTDRTGHYSVLGTNGELDTDLVSRNKGKWANRHGSLRGWVRSGDDGRYTFITQRPAPYPDTGDPAHIHMYVKEPGLVAYYIDDILFKDDTLLTNDHINSQEQRGGPGIVTPVWNGDHWEIRRDIILGQNITDY